MLSDERLAAIEELIGSSLNEDGVTAKVRYLSRRLHRFNRTIRNVAWNQCCKFPRLCGQSECTLALPLVLWPILIQANYNRLLDVARETYKENVGDIHTLCHALGEAHGLPLSLTYLDSGFVLSLKKTDLDGGDLPRGFINVCVKKGKLQFSIMELVSRFLPLPSIIWTDTTIVEKDERKNEGCVG